jgi:hypothetical protein
MYSFGKPFSGRLFIGNLGDIFFFDQNFHAHRCTHFAACAKLFAPIGNCK